MDSNSATSHDARRWRERLTCVALASAALFVGCKARPQPLTEAEALDHATSPRPGNLDRHQEIVAERDAVLASGARPRLVFVGDSITDDWRTEGSDVWDEYFAPRRAVNLGSAGDQTAHVLWRLGGGADGPSHNELEGLEPDAFVLLVGTNNTYQYAGSPEATAAGIESIVRRLLESSPRSSVLLLAIFPRGEVADDPLRQVNERVNRLIAPLGEDERVDFLDINDVFLDDEGALSRRLMPDRLHPSAAGYRRWAEAIEPHVARLLRENDAASEPNTSGGAQNDRQ